MGVVLTSAFSLGMLDDTDVILRVKAITLDRAARFAQGAENVGCLESAIGHPGTRAMVARLLHVDLPEVDPENRPRLSLSIDRDGNGMTTLVVAQYIGPRLKEGEVMSDPDPRHFVWREVTIL